MAIDKWALYEGKDGKCDLCGEKMQPTDWGCHIHHTLVYKNQVPRSKQHTSLASIDEPINIMLVCPIPCHQFLQSHREVGERIKENQYGKAAVQDYIQRLLPKTHETRGVKGQGDEQRL